MVKKENKIAVLIPCYNESKTIEKVIKDYQKALPYQLFATGGQSSGASASASVHPKNIQGGFP